MKLRARPSLPASLPRGIIRVESGGEIVATLDGEIVMPPDAGSPWSRPRIDELLDAMTMHGTRAVWVTLYEIDGQVFTEIVQGGERLAAEPPRRARKRSSHGSAVSHLELTGDGFFPGEEVLAAVGVCVRAENDEGHVVAIVDRRDLPAGAAVSLLCGRESGHTVVQDLR
ncbi:hypothetical protein [Microbacterium sp. ZXX196]|uniref:hypothetical protein n=1 Tax=Microbacterium sp. ZXX196 TaxID=2609291 RepID=UPI0012BA0A1A|nr:hypothetical protein [Microbacterium sp. ZXX196]MTE24621.1 hypothetical protein [Microbacterium sp. ZXX196]